MKKFKGHTLKQAKEIGGYWARCHTSLKMSDGSWATYKGYYYECDSRDGHRFKTLDSNGQLDPVFCHDLTNEAFNYFDPIQLFDNGQVQPQKPQKPKNIFDRKPKDAFGFSLEGTYYYARVFNMGHRAVKSDLLQLYIKCKDERIQELEETIDVQRLDNKRLAEMLNKEQLDVIGLQDARQKTIDEAVKLKREVAKLKKQNRSLKIMLAAILTPIVIGIITYLVTM